MENYYAHHFKGICQPNSNKNKYKTPFLLSLILIQSEISQHLKMMLFKKNEKDVFQPKMWQMPDFDLKRCLPTDNMESKLPKFITEDNGMVSAQFQGEV